MAANILYLVVPTGVTISAWCFTCFKTHSRRDAIYWYMIYFVLMTFLSISFLYNGPGIFREYFPGFDDCKSEPIIGNVCVGIGIVYRISFMLVVFHTLLTLFAICRNTLAKLIHEGLWFWKNVLLVAFFSSSLFISRRFFDRYEQLAAYTSSLFLLIQSLILIDFAYSWDKNWKRKMAGDHPWIWTTAYYLVSLAMVGWSFAVNFEGGSLFGGKDCKLNAMLMLATVISGSLVILLSISGVFGRGCKYFRND